MTPPPILLLRCSICVSGVCLTATALDHNTNTFKVGLAPETLRRTYFGNLRPGQMVNLERASEIGGRNSGHFVQGHVDGTGTVLNKWQDGDSLCFDVRVDDVDMLRYIVPKGFVAVDGTSLTVVDVDVTRQTFSFMLVGYTQQKIVLPSKHIGDRVNLEVDVLGKYSETALAAVLPRLEALEAKVESLERALLVASSSSSYSAKPAATASASTATSSAASSGGTASGSSSGSGGGTFGVRNAGFVAGGTASPPHLSWSPKTTADDVLQARRSPAAASTVSTTNMAPPTREAFETLEGRFNRDVMSINYTPAVTSPSTIAPMMTPRRRAAQGQQQGASINDGGADGVDAGTAKSMMKPRSNKDGSGGDDRDGSPEDEVGGNNNNDPPPQNQSPAGGRRVVISPDTGLTGTGIEFRSLLGDNGLDGRQGHPDPLL